MECNMTDISKFLISGSNFLVSDWLMLSLMAFLMSFYLWSVRAGTASSKAWVRSAHWWQIVTTITTMIAVKPLFSTCLCENKSQGNCENTTAILFHLLIIFSIDELPRLTKLGITVLFLKITWLIEVSTDIQQMRKLQKMINSLSKQFHQSPQEIVK